MLNSEEILRQALRLVLSNIANGKRTVVKLNEYELYELGAVYLGAVEKHQKDSRLK